MNDVIPELPWPAGLTFGSPLSIEKLPGYVPADLRRWCDLANEAGWLDTGIANTCIMTSHALAAYLRLMGREPWLVRVEAGAFPKCHCEPPCHGRHCQNHVLGAPSAGNKRPPAGHGMWYGHLAVGCNGYLLDPTFDQASGDRAEFPPMVFPLPPGWDDGATIFFTDADGNFMRYSKYHRQIGWKSAGAARPSRWRPVFRLMVALESQS